MPERNKLFVLSLQVIVIIFSCKKSKQSVNTPAIAKLSGTVDDIIGTYAGDLRVIHIDTGIYGTIYDTIYPNNTVYIMKRTATSFCYYHNSGSDISPFQCIEYSTANSFYVFSNNLDSLQNTLKIDTAIVIFYPEKDSMFNQYIYEVSWWSSTFFGHARTKQTFSGKKIK